MKLYILTYKRHDTQVTYNDLPEQLKKKTALVVQQCEEHLYDRTKFNEVIVLPPHINNIEPTRAWVMQNTTEEKYVMLDDDLVFFKKHPDNKSIMIQCSETKEDIIEMFDEIERDLDTYMHISCTPRLGSNRITEDFVENARPVHLHGFRNEAKNYIKFNEIDYKEDFHYALCLMKAGFKNKVYFKWICSPAPTQAKGGCSEKRNQETHNKSTLKLAELHPGLVKVVEKNYKSMGGDIKNRLECVIQWKKAFKSSQK